MFYNQALPRKHTNAYISSANEGKVVLTAKEIGLSVEVGVVDEEEGRTTIVVLNGVEGGTSFIVLDEEDMMTNTLTM
jgi:hypothetical protein